MRMRVWFFESVREFPDACWNSAHGARRLVWHKVHIIIILCDFVTEMNVSEKLLTTDDCNDIVLSTNYCAHITRQPLLRKSQTKLIIEKPF